MASFINMPIGGYPLALYGMAALTTIVLAYATISSGSSDNAGASVSSSIEKSGEGMLSSIFGSSGESKSSEGGIMGSLGSMMSPGESKEGSETPSAPPESDSGAVKGGGKHKKRRTKNKRAKRKSEKSNRK
jgi:hypothetical protein